METIRLHMARLIFWSALVLSLVSLVLAFSLHPFALHLVALSVAFNLWSLYRNDRGGFVKAREMRRAHEPRRQLLGLEVALLLVLVMVQIGTGTFLVAT